MITVIFSYGNRCRRVGEWFLDCLDQFLSKQRYKQYIIQLDSWPTMDSVTREKYLKYDPSVGFILQ